MFDFLKIFSNRASVPPELKNSLEEVQITLAPEANVTPASTPAPQTGGFLENLLSLTRRPLSGLAQLFTPASPLSTNLSVSTSYLDFGQLNVYGVAYRSFSVINNGNKDVSLMFSTSLPYSVGSGTTLSPGESASFSVSFRPTQAGNFNSYVTGNNGISISLSGKAVSPYKK